MLIHKLDTPAVICDLDKLERNIAEMAARCREIGIPLRSHVKSHKIPEIAHLQLASGAIGICCQKLGEAEVMVAAGIRDILITYPIVGPLKVDRLLRLARRADISVALDSLEAATGISQGAERMGGSVRLLVELDTGGGRCGVQSPAEASDLARRIADLPGVEFAGIATYPSRPEARPFIDETLERVRDAGLPARVVSGGGTGHEAIYKDLGCTETRSGSYIWERLSRVQGSAELSDERCPLRVITTVVSAPTRGRILVDGGIKTFTTFRPPPWGLCVEHPEARMVAMSVEHGHVDVSECPHRFQVGERLQFIPSHQEIALNMHEELVGYRGEQVEVIWPVLGRGKVK
jgi:D-serine deaminase-like pyridoxal phosphate-dependent protein